MSERQIIWLSKKYRFKDCTKGLAQRLYIIVKRKVIRTKKPHTWFHLVGVDRKGILEHL